jgi:hypothetical protein
VDVAIQVVQERDTVVIALTTTGNTESCPVVYSLLMLRGLMTGL